VTQDSASTEQDDVSLTEPRGLGRLPGRRLWTSLFGPGFVGGLVVAVTAPIIVSSLQKPTKHVTVQRAPLAVVETRREALAEAGVVNPAASPGLNDLGVSITADVVTSGYAGKALDVVCELYAVYPNPGFAKLERVSFTGIKGPQVTAPCWIQLPSSPHPRHYNAVILRVGPAGSPGQRPTALPVTPFLAPPVPPAQ
jgi:hypothetical protein